MKQFYSLIFIIFLAPSLYGQICECTNCPAALLDNATANAELNVITSCDDDLSLNPLQQVCFTINHGYISDLAISLTSPSGLQYMILGDNDNSTFTAPAQVNIDICITLGTGNPVTNGSVFMCNGPVNSGCLQGNWTVYSAPTNNNAPGTMGPTTPNTDLNDFNVPGDPVAGLWTLDVADVVGGFEGNLINWSLYFLNDLCIDECFTCDANGGTYAFNPDILACEMSTDLNISAPPFYSGTDPAPAEPTDYSYTNMISQNGILIAYETGPNLTSYAPGVYDICGLSYYTTDAPSLPLADGTVTTASIIADLTGSMPTFCGDVSDDCYSVEIVAPPADTNIDTLICYGENFLFDGNFLINAGMYQATYMTAAGCDSIVNLDLTIRPEATLDTTVILCEGETTTISGLTYGTTGQYPIFTNTPDGCDSTITLSVFLLNAYASIDASPNLDCNNPDLLLDAGTSTISSPYGGSVTFQWYLDGVPITGANSYLLYLNTPGQYIFEVTHSLFNESCIGLDTIDITSTLTNMSLDIPSIPELTCLNDTVPLMADIVIGTTNYTITWTTSNGGNIVGQDTINPILIDAAGTYIATLHDIASDCSLIESVTVTADFTQPDISISGTNIDCSNPIANLMGSSTTANAGPLWTGPVDNPTNWAVTTTTQGWYYLTVTGPNGCTSLDSIEVLQAIDVPDAEAGPDTTITCGNPCTILDGSNSTFGPDITFLWTGPGIDVTNENSVMPEVCLPGTYAIILTNTISTCADTSSLDIVLQATLPTAIANVDGIITCIVDSVGINSTGSDVGNEYTYSWTGPGINGTNMTLDAFMVGDTGQYVLTVTNTLTNCFAMDTVQVTLDQIPPTADAGLDTSISCLMPTVMLDGTNSTNGPNFQYLWTGPAINTTNENSAQPIVNQPGTYSLVITNTINGCQSLADEVEVTSLDNIPVADAGPDQAFTCVVDNILLDVDTPVTGVSYEWTLPDLSTMANMVNATDIGNYILTATNDANGCSSTDTVLINTDYIPPVAIAEVNDTLTCINTSVQLDGSNSTGDNLEYLWSGGSIDATNNTQVQPFVTMEALYTLIVTNEGNGCMDTTMVQVNTNYVAPIVVVPDTLTLTCTIDSVLVTTNNSSTGLEYAYTWTGPGINSTNIDLESFMIGDAGQYVLTITNIQTNCLAMDTLEVVLDQLLPISDAGLDTSISCAQPTVMLDGTNSTNGPNFIYTWTGPAITAANENSPQPVVNLPGIYSLTITSLINGCVSLADEVEVISLDNIPVSDAGPNQAFTCAIDNILLEVDTPVAGISYEWTLPNMSTMANMVNATEIGNYILTATDNSNGCSSSDTVLLNTDFNLPLSISSVGDILTCTNTSVQLDGSNSVGDNVNYLWSGGSIDATNAILAQPFVTMVGTYTLIVTNEGNGCMDTSFIQVDTNYTAPIVNLQDTLILTCTFDTLMVSMNNSSAGTDFTYLWTGPGIDGTNQNGPNQEFYQAGDYTLQITNEANGCPETDILTVVEDMDMPNASTADGAIDCINTEALLTGSSTTDFSQYAWVDLDGNVNPGATYMADTAGNYTFIVTGINGCINDTEKANVIASFLEPDIAADDAVIDCINQTVQLVGSSNTPGVTYTWTDQSTTTLSMTSTVDISTPGTYTVEGLAPNGCTSDSIVVVTEQTDYPTFELVEEGQLDCVEEDSYISVQNLAAGNYDYDWTGTSNDFDILGSGITVHEPGNYTLLLTNTDNGCPTTLDIDVSSNTAEPSAQLSTNDIACFGDDNGAVTISNVSGGMAPYLYALNDGTFSTDPIFTNLAAGQYTYHIQDANGCPWDSLITVNEAQQINMDIIPFTTNISLGDSTLLSAIVSNTTDIDTIIWTGDISTYLSEFEVMVSPTHSTMYEVTMINDSGCSTNAYFYLEVEAVRDVFVPFAFTPNQDGVNDFAFIQAGDQVEQINSFIIVDRWGEIVYKRENFTPNIEALGWDGIHNGSPVNSAVFMYVLDVQYIDGMHIEYKGDITLVR